MALDERQLPGPNGMSTDVLYLALFAGGITFGWRLARRAAKPTQALLEEQIRLESARLAESQAEARRLSVLADAVGRETADLRAEVAALRVGAERAIKLDSDLGDARASLLKAQERLAGAEARVEQLSEIQQEVVRLREELAASQQARAEAEGRADSLPRVEGRLTEVAVRHEEARAEVTRLKAANASLMTQVEEAGRRVVEQGSLLKQAETNLREAFKALSAEALASNNHAFIDLAKSIFSQLQDGAKTDLEARHAAVGRLVEPLQQALTKFDTAVRGLEKDRVEAYAGLKEQVLALKGGQDRLNVETTGLVRALRAPVSRGRWGEIQLRRVVEMAGMVENCDFNEQAHIPTDGGRLRPDVVVRVPGGKTTVIDSKVPLTAYLDALEAVDETSRKTLLRDHARQVRNHVSQLSDKAYWDQLDGSPDFVIMYLPMESAFAAALQEDPTLIDFAVERSVIPTGPMTLLSHLKAAAYGWRQERIAANAAHISDLGKELYNRIGTLAGHLAAVGTHLGKTVDSYNSAAGSLERRVLVQARKFRDLGAATREEIPVVVTVDVVPRRIEQPALLETDGEVELLSDPQSAPAR